MTAEAIGPSTQPVGGGYSTALGEDDAAELYETAPCGYLSTGASGHVLKANRTFLEWTGYTAAELYDGRRIQDLLPVGDRIFYETHFAPALELQGHVREIAVELVCATGARLPVLLNAVRTGDGAMGSRGAIRIAVFDARERRAYEQELVASRQAAERAADEARELAETLQQTLLPPRLPSVGWIELGGAYRPAGDGRVVGGDFYDAFELRDDSWGFVIGDVCGKGAEAAVVTALVRYTIRAIAVRSSSEADVLANLHDVLDREAVQGFVTAVYLTARAADEGVQVRLAIGGHPLPKKVTADGTLQTVGVAGSFLGMLGPPRLTDARVTLEAGDTLVLFTDGVTEARNGDRFFGEAGLDDAIAASRGGSAQQVADVVAAAAVDFQDGDTRDDIAVLVLRAPAD